MRPRSHRVRLWLPAHLLKMRTSQFIKGRSHRTRRKAEIVAQVLEPPAGADEAQASVRDEAGGSRTEASSLVEKSAPSAKSQTKPRIRRGERGKSANARVAAQSAAAPKRHDNRQGRSSRELFFHELVTLDEEIKTLRMQLAQKLHLQNVQLKTMLERFEIT